MRVGVLDERTGVVRRVEPLKTQNSSSQRALQGHKEHELGSAIVGHGGCGCGVVLVSR